MMVGQMNVRYAVYGVGRFAEHGQSRVGYALVLILYRLYSFRLAS